MSDESRARELLARIYEKRWNAVSVSPSWLATEAMRELDPDRSSNPLEYSLAHLQLRQLARSVCAGRWEKPAAVSDQHEMFPDLQRRYPIAGRSGDQEPEYRLLEHLSDDDVAFNVSRLRAEASSKQRHADALEAWGRSRGREAA